MVTRRILLGVFIILILLSQLTAFSLTRDELISYLEARERAVRNFRVKGVFDAGFYHTEESGSDPAGTVEFQFETTWKSDNQVMMHGVEYRNGKKASESKIAYNLENRYVLNLLPVYPPKSYEGAEAVGSISVPADNEKLFSGLSGYMAFPKYWELIKPVMKVNGELTMVYLSDIIRRGKQLDIKEIRPGVYEASVQHYPVEDGIYPSEITVVIDTSDNHLFPMKVIHERYAPSPGFLYILECVDHVTVGDYKLPSRVKIYRGPAENKTPDTVNYEEAIYNVVELNKPEIDEMSFKIPFDEKTVIYDEGRESFH